MNSIQEIFEKLDDELITWYFHNSKTIEKTFEDKIRERCFQNSMKISGFHTETLELQNEMYIYIRQLLHLKENMFLEEILKTYPYQLTVHNLEFIRIFNERNDQNNIFHMFRL